METASQESTETRELQITDEDVGFAEYERLRSGEKVEVQKSAPAKKASENDDDESGTSKKLEAKSDDDFEGDELDESVEDRPKKAKGAEKRIKKLVSDRNAERAEKERARQEAEYWRQKALAKEGENADKNASDKDAKPKATEGKPKAPDPNIFDTNYEYELAREKYLEDLAEWKAEEKIKALKEADRQEKLRAETESRTKSFQEKVQEFAAQHDDFDDVISDVDHIQISVAVRETLLDSEHGAALMYELAKNPEEYERICKLPALAASRAIGRIEARLEKASGEEKEETKVKTTKAPPPVSPVSSKSATAAKKSIDDENISFAEYERIRREQMRKR